MKIKNFVKYFKEGILKYFKISMKFLNISKWNISSCISKRSYGWWRRTVQYRLPGPAGNVQQNHLQSVKTRSLMF